MTKIGIVGGYGEVGAFAARRLTGAAEVRIGGRQVDVAREFASAIGAEHQRVDFLDQSTVDSFVDGCDVLVNCAGPSQLIGDRLATAAFRAGVDYVDAAGDDPLHARLAPPPGRVAVLSAGLSPGLTGLLPRLPFGLDRTIGLTVHFGLLDRFTEVAAADYLHGADTGLSAPSAAWREGPRAGVLSRIVTVLPYFPGEVTLLPQLSTEAERVAGALGLSRGDWYSVLSGEHVLSAFDRVRGLERSEAIATLRRASLLDLTGRESFVVLAVRADGIRDGEPATRTVVLRGRGNAELTGAMTALTALAVSRGEVAHGRHYAAEVLDPQRTLAELTGPGGPARLVESEDFALAEEGTL